ncbi:MAG: bifunctional glutamate N-acetyltransferase/amino-acid acetyltransferase ArgJ [Candidatus Omnitrophica bacterium]|nr:bifunctional glutamate N-acetyltransferase/amino-acid acetyltransferase ArgJ [Candidatus Omnitrophota bacterium]
MTRVEGGITAPVGFLAAGAACGIKRRGKDLALILSERSASVAGTLTPHPFRASSVDWCRAVLQRGRARAIVVNSGNANCCTGRKGVQATAQMARETALHLGVRPREVLVASTGVIGKELPLERVKQGIREASGQLSRRGSHWAAEAILTTDTRPKELALRFGMGRGAVTLGGIAKGSGMVSPRMATMLAFLTTDARIEPALLRAMLKGAVAESFNAVTVDGEMSTNDLVLLMANGAGAVAPLRAGSPAGKKFQAALGKVCQFLAHEIVRDGEGVSRTMRVTVTGAADPRAASAVARRVAESLLVKTMVAGRDPNWGRIAAAAGNSLVRIDPRKVSIQLGGVAVFRRGQPLRVKPERLLAAVDQPEVRMAIELGNGPGKAQMISGDLTEGYVRINAKYTT